jgi:hypothetical protein
MENQKEKFEEFEVELFNQWVKGKVYTDVSNYPCKYREFCAIVTFDPEKGEVKKYLPYCNNKEVSFKFTDVKVGDVLYLGYINEYKHKTMAREYCKVIEKHNDYALLICGFKGYITASTYEHNPDSNTNIENEEI